ncbi:uncharacterized protein LOC131252934 isoform X2 [Magnolia sinica]|uniref:uncharacterized protein LOC131252934 isoform X2 n=1 Tax=Magnolia sinica TaxID=86752 RepID=UPI00265A5D1A|nr:uncharacterized protein LOC131252934 isoform X2 [Magnolia sinica]
MLKIKRTDFSISSYPHPPLFNACNPRRNSHHEFPLRQAKDFGRFLTIVIRANTTSCVRVKAAVAWKGQPKCSHKVERSTWITRVQPPCPGKGYLEKRPE